MQSNPIVYQIFSSKELALELANLLSENNIAFKTEVFNATFDAAFTNNSNKDYVIKINPSDFEKVDTILLEAMKDEIDNVNESYYLFEFSDEELFDLIRKRDEWSQFDVLLAKKILQSKDVAFSHELDNKIKQERIAELAEPKKAHIAYITAIFIFSILAIFINFYIGYSGFYIGFLGFFVGLHLGTSKTTLPNGKQVFEYSSKDRIYGKEIMLINIVGIIISVSLSYLKELL
jgi:hypothetical protein